MGKYIRKGCQKSSPTYTKSIQLPPASTTIKPSYKIKGIQPACPHQWPDQSSKPKRVRGASSKHPFASNQRQETKELFSLWIESSSPSKAILFLAFHTIQNKHNGPAFHTFLRLLVLKRPMPLHMTCIYVHKYTHAYLYLC